MSRKRKARLDISSPALDAIHQDNTVAAPAADTPTPAAPPSQPVLAPKADKPPPKSLSRPVKPDPKSLVRRVAQPSHPLSFRLGITDAGVVAAAEALAASHGADPMLVLKRFVRDAMADLKTSLVSGDLSRFSKITDRPRAEMILTSTVRIDRDGLEVLKARMDPLDLFAPSAVLGFALDQILTETHGGEGSVLSQTE